MRYLFFILILPSLVVGQTVKLKKQVLYDKYEKPDVREKITPIIFDDAKGTMWASLEDCGSFQITNKIKAKTGKNCIDIEWDKAKGCEWIGFGNSFSNWNPVDMSEDIYTKAFSMYARTKSGTSATIPFVLSLEDNSEGGCYEFIDPKYVNGLTLDTTWTQVIFPLWHFPDLFNEDEFDIYTVRQFKVQLEGAGKFYVDDLKLIDFTNEDFEKMQAYKESLKPSGNPNQKVYTEGKLADHAWGVGEKFCYTLSEENDSSNTYIKWKYNAKDCAWNQWGINWNNWYQINLKGVDEVSQLKFKMKTDGESKFKIKLEDFNGHSSILNSVDYVRANQPTWIEVSIPLNDFNLKGNNFKMDQIRQLAFMSIGKGTVYFDDIEILEIK